MSVFQYHSYGSLYRSKCLFLKLYFINLALKKNGFVGHLDPFQSGFLYLFQRFWVSKIALDLVELEKLQNVFKVNRPNGHILFGIKWVQENLRSPNFAMLWGLFVRVKDLYKVTWMSGTQFVKTITNPSIGRAPNFYYYLTTQIYDYTARCMCNLMPFTFLKQMFLYGVSKDNLSLMLYMSCFFSLACWHVGAWSVIQLLKWRIHCWGTTSGR